MKYVSSHNKWSFQEYAKNIFLVIRPFEAVNIRTRDKYKLNIGDKVNIKKYINGDFVYRAKVNKKEIHLTSEEIDKYLLNFKLILSDRVIYREFQIEQKLLLGNILLSENKYDWSHYIANGESVPEMSGWNEDTAFSNADWKKYSNWKKYCASYRDLKMFLDDINDVLYIEIFIYLQDMWVWANRKALKRYSKKIFTNLDDMMQFLADNSNKDQCIEIIKKYALLIRKIYSKVFVYEAMTYQIQNAAEKSAFMHNKIITIEKEYKMKKEEKYLKELASVNKKLQNIK